MKKFKITFIKQEPIKTLGKEPMRLAEQIIFTNKPGLTIQNPLGYVLFQIIEYLPDITEENEKTTN
jgi:hypothetical protein